MGTLAFGCAAFSVFLPWQYVDGELVWEIKAKQLYELVLLGAIVGIGLLFVASSVRAAAWTVAMASLTVAPGVYAYYEVSRDSATGSDVGPGLYVALSAGCAALAVSGIWTLVKWINRHPLPETFSTFSEPFPRL